MAGACEHGNEPLNFIKSSDQMLVTQGLCSTDLVKICTLVKPLSTCNMLVNDNYGNCTAPFLVMVI